MNHPLTELIDLSDRTAIVTGGAMGIGLCIGLRLHEAGASVVVADIAEEAAVETAALLNERRADSTLPVRADVADVRSVSQMVDATVRRFGGVEVLVNNAGIFPIAPLTQMSEADFMKVIDVNLRGVYLCTRAVADRMIEQGRGGRIINVTSIDAVHPSMVGLGHYDASKHGVWGFTKNTALELAAHRIWVNAIAPGGVLTPGVIAMQADGEDAMADVTQGIPMGRLADPDEIGRVALFLASELASYMTGAQVVVDGGLLLT